MTEYAVVAVVFGFFIQFCLLGIDYEAAASLSLRSVLLWRVPDRPGLFGCVNTSTRQINKLRWLQRVYN